MAEYIEREKAWRKVNRAKNIEEALNIIDSLPTADVDKVKHGEWIKPYINKYGHPCHCCSLCGFKASQQDKNFCPNCGAKMDLRAGADNDR